VATLYQQIADKFLAQLASAKDVEPTKIEQLRILLAGIKKPRAEDLVKIFSQADGGETE
jgi:hypothetical protein